VPAEHQCLTPVILATQDAEIRRIPVGGQQGQIVYKTLSQKPIPKRAGRVVQGESSEFKPQNHKKIKIKKNNSWALVAHACDPSYSGGRDQEDCCSKPAWANSSRDPIWSELFSHSLVITEPNWAAMGDAERTQDRQRVGARCVGHLGGAAQPSLLYSLHLLCFFSLSLLFKALLLYNSLKPCFPIL
jgi:hypothetical protein